MNKINIDLFDYQQLRIETIQQIKLEKFWDKIQLTGGFWRIYHHDAPGAGVWLDGQKVELLPNFLYLLPQHSNLTAWCGKTPIQLYLHFEVTKFFGNHQYLVNPLPLTPALAAIVTELRQLLTEDAVSGRIQLLGMLLASTALAALPQDALTERMPDYRIGRVCDYLRIHLNEEISLPQLANMAEFSPNGFIRRFKEVTGDTPYGFLLHLRYTQAARLLESTSLTIEELIEYIGVKDRFHFSRRFKKFYGTSPANYRKTHTRH